MVANWIDVRLDNLSQPAVRAITNPLYCFKQFPLPKIVELRDPHFKLEYRKEHFYPPVVQEIEFLGDDRFRVFCECGKADEEGLCEHLGGAFCVLAGKLGAFYFMLKQDHSEKDNALLAPYGLKVGDAEARDFKFDYHPQSHIYGIVSRPQHALTIRQREELTASLKFNVKLPTMLITADTVINWYANLYAAWASLILPLMAARF